MASTPFITVRFLRWQGLKAQWWAFGSQGFALRQPWSADGLRFAKQLGSSNPLNNARAVVKGLAEMRTYKQVASERDMTVEELFAA